MSKDMYVDYTDKVVHVPVGSVAITIPKYWVEIPKKLGLLKVQRIGELDPFYFNHLSYPQMTPELSEKMRNEISELANELKQLQEYLLNLDDVARSYASDRLPPIIEALEEAVKNWHKVNHISFG